MRRITLSICAAALLCAGVASAHEIGTSRVSAVFQHGTYNIELVTDATALIEKLEAVSGAPPTKYLSAAQLQSLLTGFDDKFRQRVIIAFDDARVNPAITYAVTGESSAISAPAATIRLIGPIPSGASHFTWNYAWTFASYALTVQGATEWLEGGQTSAPRALGSTITPADRLRVIWRYLTLGFTHILPKGLDHILFVLGIYLLSGRARSVLWQVSAFTVAHSITLGLSMYGMLTVSPRIVEPMIAVSIAYVAVENIFLSELKAWRIGLVFGFGLLHGMGFAGALKELGLPRPEFLTALLSFNVGVETGQLAVIGAAFLLVGWQLANRSWYRGRIVVPASALIACTAVYWTIERLSF